MKKVILLLTALTAALFMVSCGGEEPTPDDNVTLTVERTALTFDAVSSKQVVAITAVGATWSGAVAADASSWLSAVKNGDQLDISVAENSSEERRIGTILVSAGTKKETITVTQKAVGEASDYTLTLTPSALSFVGEGAVAQDVVVTTTGEGLTWKVEVAAKDNWIHAEAKDGKIVVTVDDNPKTLSRVANFTVIPSISSVTTKAVRVEQAAKVLPASLAVTDYDGNPLTSIKFKFRADDEVLKVKAVNTVWSLHLEDVEGNKVTGTTWLTATKTSDELATIKAKANEVEQARTLCVVFTSNVETIEPIKITVSQDAYSAVLSTLTDDVEMNNPNAAQGGNQGEFYARWDASDIKSSLVEVAIWGDGVTFNGMKYSGTGDRMNLKFYTDKLPQSDEQVVEIAAGVYNIVPVAPEKPADLLPGIMCPGEYGNSDVYVKGSWFYRIADGVVTGKAPLMGGTMTVAKTGDVYTFTFNFTDDADYSITGSYATTLNRVSFNSGL